MFNQHAFYMLVLQSSNSFHLHLDTTLK